MNHQETKENIMKATPIERPFQDGEKVVVVDGGRPHGEVLDPGTFVVVDTDREPEPGDRVVQVGEEYAITRKGWMGTVVRTGLPNDVIVSDWDDEPDYPLPVKREHLAVIVDGEAPEAKPEPSHLDAILADLDEKIEAAKGDYEAACDSYADANRKKFAASDRLARLEGARDALREISEEARYSWRCEPSRPCRRDGRVRPGDMVLLDPATNHLVHEGCANG